MITNYYYVCHTSAGEAYTLLRDISRDIKHSSSDGKIYRSIEQIIVCYIQYQKE